VVDGPGAVVPCDARHLQGSAVDVLDALARLQLAARRAGGEIRLRGADDDLLRLLEVTGLAAVVRVEREPEPGEEAGI
jgi:hypothetical protein